MMGSFMSDGKKTTYSSTFKEEAVRLFLQGGSSYRQLCEELGIKDKKSLREWVAKVNSGNRWRMGVVKPAIRNVEETKNKILICRRRTRLCKKQNETI